MSPPPHAASDGWINVRDCGAAGDGATDDTPAIARAIADLPAEAGVLYFPPGRYLTDVIDMPDETTFLGTTAWSYRREGGTVLSPVRDDQPCLIDANDSVGTRWVGLTFDGLERGDGMHGIVARKDRSGRKREMDPVIDGCHFLRFTGSGVRLTDAWAWHVRHSFFHRCRLDGLDASGSYDAWILDCIFAGNGRYGLNGNVLAAATVTGCRVEWNHVAGIRIGPEYSDSVQVCNGLFDANYGPGLWVEGGSHHALSITGNVFRHNGQGALDDPAQCCHVRLCDVRGAAMTGNTMVATKVSAKHEYACPTTAVHIGRLRDSVVTGNALYHAATGELIADAGGNENLVLRDNPGSIQAPDGMEY